MFGDKGKEFGRYAKDPDKPTSAEFAEFLRAEILPSYTRYVSLFLVVMYGLAAWSLARGRTHLAFALTILPVAFLYALLWYLVGSWMVTLRFTLRFTVAAYPVAFYFFPRLTLAAASLLHAAALAKVVYTPLATHLPNTL